MGAEDPREAALKIWVVSGEYPAPDNPGSGVFVKNQVEALRDAGHVVHVLHSPSPTLRPLAKEARPRLQAVAEKLPRRRAVEALDDADVRAANGRTQRTQRARAVLGATARGAVATARILHDQVGHTVAVSRLFADMMRLASGDGAPDVVHAHNVFPAGIAAGQWAVGREIPYVVTEHRSAYLRHEYSPVELAAAIRVLDRAAAVIAVSSAQAEALPIPTDRVTVVPEITHTGDVALRDAQARTSGSVLGVGALIPHQRLDSLMRAYAELPAELRSWHSLRIVGSGPERDRLADLAEIVGLSPDVLLGDLPREALVREMAGAAVLVSCSAAEAFGRTLIEGLAAGVPFVATDSGGPRDLAGPDMGVLVESHDPVPLTRAIAKQLRAPTAVAFDEARRMAVRRYGPAAVAQDLERVYGSVRGHRPA